MYILLLTIKLRVYWFTIVKTTINIIYLPIDIDYFNYYLFAVIYHLFDKEAICFR